MLHSLNMDTPEVTREVHIFCDASECAYGSLACLCSVNFLGNLHLSFLIGRARVNPKKQLSIPKLELCAALTGAQLLKVIKNELTLKILSFTLWSDSITVLRWLHSTSCHFKVFFGTRIAEMQDLTHQNTWRYVESSRNPADDLTRGQTLAQLAQPNGWSHGPQFLLQTADKWPSDPPLTPLDSPQELTELKRSAVCSIAVTSLYSSTAEQSKAKTWPELIEVPVKELHGAAVQNYPSAPSMLPVEMYREAEQHIFRQIQRGSFAEDHQLLKVGKIIQSNSRLSCLSPHFDRDLNLI